MSPNASYVCRLPVSTTNNEDEPVRLEAGRLYKACDFKRIACSITGEVLELPLHIARNPSWYFDKQGEIAYTRAPVTQQEYVRELVRGNEGLDVGELYKLAAGEAFGPYCKPISYNVFTSCLSKLTEVEMRKDGLPVKGVKHGQAGCTYHWRRQAKGRDGLFAS